MLWLLLNIRDTSYPKNYVRVVALTPVLGRASFTSETGFFHHNSTIEFILSSKFVNNLHPSHKIPSQG